MPGISTSEFSTVTPWNTDFRRCKKQNKTKQQNKKNPKNKKQTKKQDYTDLG